jgi:hypothetical protein
VSEAEPDPEGVVLFASAIPRRCQVRGCPFRPVATVTAVVTQNRSWVQGGACKKHLSTVQQSLALRLQAAQDAQVSS